MTIGSVEMQKGEMMNNDTISRQAAIDLVKDVCDAIMCGCESWYDPEIEDEVYKDILEVDAILKCNKEVRIALRNMPSAQAERTCVNCGRTVNNGGWYADGGTRCPIEEHYALPKDGYCHLWEKRNMTDDDYPERREK